MCSTVSAVSVGTFIGYLAVFTQGNNICDYIPKALFGRWVMKDDASHIMKCNVM